ncbi:MAG: hypothetical protein VKQ33_12565 [Candidatus Sericytochromatia bacterium]|nr:hypothetical protein [Candidatus Sericytochromatia bacterium]
MPAAARRAALPRPRPRPTSPPPSLGARAAALLAGAWLSAGKPLASSPASAAPTPAGPDAALTRRVARQAAQVSMRLHVKLRRGNSGVWGHRTADGLARVLLAPLPDGGSKLLLTADLAFVTADPEVRRRLPRTEQLPGGGLEAFLERFPAQDLGWWLRVRPGFELVDAFVATYMPPGRGTSSAARYEWWASLLRGRLEAARRPAGEEGIWTPTFNVGARVGQAFLTGQDFTLQLYIPPEDPGL